jgi:RNA polymerase sigma-70 factor, ECF subfamily
MGSMPRFHTRHDDFRRLTDPISRALWRYGYWLTGSGTAADDLVQESLLRGWSSFAQIRDEEAIKPWLFKILKNEFLRRRIRSGSSGFVELDELSEDQLASTDPQLATFEVRDAISRLPLDYREPLLLQVADGFSLDEIAAMLDLPSNTVASRVFRARALLRDLLGLDRETAKRKEAAP